MWLHTCTFVHCFVPERKVPVLGAMRHEAQRPCRLRRLDDRTRLTALFLCSRPRHAQSGTKEHSFPRNAYTLWWGEEFTTYSTVDVGVTLVTKLQTLCNGR